MSILDQLDIDEALKRGSDAAKDFASSIDLAADKVAALAGAYGSLYAIQELTNSKIYQSLMGSAVQLAQVPRQIASEVVGSSVLLSTEMTNASDKMTQNALAIQRAAYSDQQELAQRQILIGKTIGGQDLTLPIQGFFRNAADLGEAFYKGALADTRLYSAAIETATSVGDKEFYKLKETSALVMKGMGLNIQDMNILYQEEFSKTGKISGEVVNNFAATILAAAKETGLGIDQLAADMSRMIRDVDRFGNMTKAQMTSLSAAIHQIGLDMEDVRSVTDKFVSFENASQAIANIGAVTGATLDTMELFYLANEDKEEFFRSMRQNLLDQGVTLENLSHQEQVYLSRQLGFSSVRQLQSLLNEEIDFTTGNITDKIEEAAASQDYVGDKLAAQLAQTGGLAKETLAAMKPENLAGMLDGAKNLTLATSQVADAATTINSSLLSMTKNAIPAMTEGAQKMETGIVSSTNEIIQKFDEVKKKIEEFVQNALPKDAKGASPAPMWYPFINGVKGMADAVKGEFAELNDDTRSRLKEAAAFEADYVNTIGLTKDARDKQLQDRYGGEGRALADADVDKLIAAYDSKNQADIKSVILAKQTAAAPASPTAPSAPAPPVPPAPEAPAATPAVTSTSTSVATTPQGELAIKVKLELDTSALSDLVKATLPDILGGGIDMMGPNGQAGRYKFVPAVA